MFYKAEVQKKNGEKLKRKLIEDGIPSFMWKYFTVKITSKYGALKYLSVIEKFLNYLIEKRLIEKESISEIEPKDFENIMAEDITEFLRNEEMNGISPTTLGVRKDILSGFWNFLARLKECDIPDGFFKDVTYTGVSTKDKTENLIKKFPTQEKMDQMEQKILKSKNDLSRVRNLAIFNILKGTGIRKCEFAGLNISDLYLDEKVPYIKVVGKGKYREIEARRVYLSKSAYKTLKAWLRYRETLKNITDKDAVFINKNGGRVVERTIDKFFETYGNGLKPHMFRHWYVSVMAKQNLTFTQQQVGHTSIQTIISNYDNGVYGMEDTLAKM